LKKHNTQAPTFLSLRLCIVTGSLLSFFPFWTKKLNLKNTWVLHNPFEYRWKKSEVLCKTYKTSLPSPTPILSLKKTIPEFVSQITNISNPSHCIARNIKGWLKICTLFMIYSQIWLNIAPTKLFQNYLFQSYSYKAREHHTLAYKKPEPFFNRLLHLVRIPHFFHTS
jgi:hypothetical protein